MSWLFQVRCCTAVLYFKYLHVLIFTFRRLVIAFDWLLCLQYIVCTAAFQTLRSKLYLSTWVFCNVLCSKERGWVLNIFKVQELTVLQRTVLPSSLSLGEVEWLEKLLQLLFQHECRHEVTVWSFTHWIQ